jgi:hypothetical protein
MQWLVLAARSRARKLGCILPASCLRLEVLAALCCVTGAQLPTNWR